MPDEPSGSAAEPLADLVQREGPLPPARALAITAAIAGLLAALPEPLRDLAPARVLVEPGGRVRLTTPGATQPDAFRAPEQSYARGEGAADVFALGAILFYALTGREPRLLGGALDLPTTDALRRQPEAVAALVRRALAPRAADRYPDVREMAAAMRQVASPGDTAASGPAAEPPAPPALDPAATEATPAPVAASLPETPPAAHTPVPPPGPRTFDERSARARRPEFMGGLPIERRPAPPGAPPPPAGMAPPSPGAVGPPPPGAPQPPPERAWPYPMRFDVAYAPQQERLVTVFRLILLVPVLLFGYFVSAALQALIVAGWIAAFITRRYPKGMFSAAHWALGWHARALAYGLLLTDRFPSFDPAGSPVQLQYRYPEAGSLSRWRVLLWKLVLLIPQVIVLGIIGLAVAVVVFIAWWAILFTGRYPRGLFGFVEGYLRWNFRITGYLASFNDHYPPYSFAPDSGPASRGSTVANGVIGAIVGPGLGGLLAVGLIIALVPRVVHVDYDGLAAGEVAYIVEIDELGSDARIELVRAYDDASQLALAPPATPGNRIVAFEWVVGVAVGYFGLSGDDLSLSWADGVVDGAARPLDLQLDERRQDLRVDADGAGRFLVYFEIPMEARPESLRFDPDLPIPRRIRYEFDR